MERDKDIVGSIEFLEVVGLQGSTYLLKGPNDESVKL
ncbi:MAG: RNA-binding protein, partial [Staphylococcus epidermidis]|nr:RNA-binding protein [Staphylococcus epidermidis]